MNLEEMTLEQLFQAADAILPSPDKDSAESLFQQADAIAVDEGFSLEELFQQADAITARWNY